MSEWNLSPEEADAANDSTVGEGTPETAPRHLPPASRLERQPLAWLWALAVTADTILVTVPDLPVWVKVAALVAVNLAAGAGAWRRVTPVADPRLDADTPLTAE